MAIFFLCLWWLPFGKIWPGCHDSNVSWILCVVGWTICVDVSGPWFDKISQGPESMRLDIKISCCWCACRTSVRLERFDHRFCEILWYKVFHVNRENEENVDNTAKKLRVPNEKISTQINIGKLAQQNLLPNDAQTSCPRHSEKHTPLWKSNGTFFQNQIWARCQDIDKLCLICIKRSTGKVKQCEIYRYCY